jgi:hypothetical protein
VKKTSAKKLGADRYSERRAEWATGWLAGADGNKSDATEAEEKSRSLRVSNKPNRYLARTLAALALVLLLASVLLSLKAG